MAKTSRRTIARIVAEKLTADGADGAAIMREVAAYLLDNNLVDDADMIINDIAEELYLQTGRLVVEVTSARPLSPEARQNLVGYLQKEVGASDVELHEMVDEDLIGGLIARTPSAELDVSVRNKLRQLTALA
jgi:F-type H+-transporting ATPase subunit delta